MSGGRPEDARDGEPGARQGPTCARPGPHAGDAPAASPGPGGSASPSSDWHARLGPLDFSVGIRRFELRGVFPEQPPARPGAAAEDAAPQREPEGGTAG